MGDLNKYFSREEFACKCGCGYDTVDAETLEVLTKLRKHFNSPVTITSAARCTEHNKAVGGAADSMHIKGRACDIKVKGVKSVDVFNYLDSTYFNKYGIGRYVSFTHLDTRSGPRRRW